MSVRCCLCESSRYLKVFSLVCGVILTGGLATQTIQAQKPPMSEQEVVRLLKGDVTPKRVAELARERGIGFHVTREIETELRKVGADSGLMKALREAQSLPATVSPPLLHFVFDRALAGQNAQITALTFNADSNLLASVSVSGDVLVWDVATGAETRHLPPSSRLPENIITARAFAPDLSALAYAAYGNPETTTVFLRDVKSGRQTAALRTRNQVVSSLAFSPEGRVLAAGTGSGQVDLLGVTTDDAPRSWVGHKGTIFSLAFSPDGHTLASASTDGTARLWDERTGRELEAFDACPQGSRIANGIPIEGCDIAFTHDGSGLVAAPCGGAVSLWDVSTGRKVRDIDPTACSKIALSADDRLLASGHLLGGLVIWDVATGKRVQTLTDETGISFFSLAASPDGAWLAAGYQNGTVQLWRREQ